MHKTFREGKCEHREVKGKKLVENNHGELTYAFLSLLYTLVWVWRVGGR